MSIDIEDHVETPVEEDLAATADEAAETTAETTVESAAERSVDGSSNTVDVEGGEATDTYVAPAADGPSLRAAVEAVLLVVDAPVDATTLAQVCERPRGEVEATLAELAEEYAAEGRGIALREVAGGWRFYTREECAAVVERFVRDGQQTRLTQAALETLAVVAYRQPVSRSRVSAVRGVNVDGVMRTLLTRGLVEEAGTEEESGAVLYRTTNLFLEKLGLNSLSELPELAPLLPDLSSLEGDLDLPSS